MAHLPYDIVNTMDMIGGKCIVNPNTVVDIPLYLGCTFANIFGFSIIFEIQNTINNIEITVSHSLWCYARRLLILTRRLLNIFEWLQ